MYNKSYSLDIHLGILLIHNALKGTVMKRLLLCDRITYNTGKSWHLLFGGIIVPPSGFFRYCISVTCKTRDLCCIFCFLYV
uniref:Uncharacterized protein n=1 Tax=Pyxicephalus adspersus TaxID=30357 RepID=A0AAV3AWB2_PYXAD|nr:TPA: hypothetical protein GDO54_005950 [Pyxicephalus adspersus]